MSSLINAYRTQSMIVHALLMKEMMHSRHIRAKSRFGIIINIVEPTAMIFTIVAMRFYVSGSNTLFGMPLAVFVTTGYMPFHFSRMTLMDVSNATRKKPPALMFPTLTTLDGIIAGVMNAFVIYTIAILISFVIVIGFFGGTPPTDMLLAFISIYLILWYSSNLGILFGVACRIWPIVTVLIGPMTRVSILISGSLYLAIELPPNVLRIAQWNPLLVGIEMMREAWIEGYVSPVARPGFLIFVNLALTVIGVALERTTRRFKFA